jgi:hypothetical protein
MVATEKNRLQSFEIKTLKHNVLCKCGRGIMIGTGAVKSANGASGLASRYDHQHKCNICGVIEWFSDKYPMREEREVPVTPDEGVIR